MTILKLAVSACGVIMLTSLLGCSTTSRSDYAMQSSDKDDYVYILDYERIALIEEANRTSASNVDTVWINPPVKRIKRSELEALRKKSR